MHHRNGMSWSLWVVILALCLPPPILCAQDIEPEEEDEDEATFVPLEGTGGGVVYTPFVVGALAIGAGAGYVVTQEDDEGDSPLDRATGLTEPFPEVTTGGGRSRVDTRETVYILSGRYLTSDVSCEGPSYISFVSNAGATSEGSASVAVDGEMPGQGGDGEPGEGNCPCDSVSGLGVAQVDPNAGRVSLSGVECSSVTGGPADSTFYNRPNWSFNRSDYVDIGDDTRVIRALVHPEGPTFRLVSP